MFYSLFVSVFSSFLNILFRSNYLFCSSLSPLLPSSVFNGFLFVYLVYHFHSAVYFTMFLCPTYWLSLELPR